MKHLSRPTILGFGHPSGALEDGARGKILVFKQWKWTDYYIMWSLCIVESTVLARQTKKLSKFEVRDEFCQQYKMPGGTNFFRGTKFFYDWPYLGCFDFLLRKWLAGQIFLGAQNFFTIDPVLEKSQVKSGPQKSPNLTVWRVSHPNFDTGIQFSMQNHIYKGSQKGFFRLPS